MFLYQVLASIIHGKIKNLKYLLQHEIKNVNYLIDYILYLIFKIILSTSLEIINLDIN